MTTTNLLNAVSVTGAGTGVLVAGDINSSITLNITSTTSEFNVVVYIEDSADNITYTQVKSWIVNDSSGFVDSFSYTVTAGHYVRANVISITGTVSITSTITTNTAPPYSVDSTTGNINTTGTLTSAYTIGTTYTIATLPTAAAALKGARAFVSNAQTAPTFGLAVTTTGAVFSPVYCDGTGWFYG